MTRIVTALLDGGTLVSGAAWVSGAAAIRRGGRRLSDHPDSLRR